MATVKARLNWGRWIAECPKQHSVFDSKALEVVPGKDTVFICPACYPKSIAVFTGMIDGRLQTVPDVSARRTAKNMADKAGEVYPIEYPPNIERILAVVGKRERQNQNWEPGETLTFLRSENKRNGI